MNKEQQSKILHLEDTVADLIGRIAAMEDKANLEETKSQRTTRSKTPQDPQMEEKLKAIAEMQEALEGRLEEVELMVDQLNDTST